MKTVSLSSPVTGDGINLNCLRYEDDKEYFEQPADKLKVGSTMLKMYRSNPYLFYRTYIEKKAPEPESKPEYKIGHAVEALVFGWPEKVVCSDMATARSKAHTEAVDAHPDCHVLTIPEWEMCHALALEVQGDAVAQIVLRQGQAQMAGRVDMDEFYLQCKHDWLIMSPDQMQAELFESDGPVVVDFKTTANMRGNYMHFGRQVYEFGYVEQAALYQIIHHQLTGVIPAWYWLVVEKEWPREVALFKADEDMLYGARRRVKSEIASLQSAIRTGSFSNASELVEIIYGRES